MPNCKSTSFILGFKKISDSVITIRLKNHQYYLNENLTHIFQVGSNTPSVVGESLENFSLEGVQQQGETVKKAWVSILHNWQIRPPICDLSILKEIRGEEIKQELVRVLNLVNKYAFVSSST